jgi:hypothetical protein
MAGFWISAIRIIGDDVTPAEISFAKQLNVISGASDTGKSYILHCINYMLGAQDPPKSVPEDAGYDTALMELTTWEDEKIVLQRSLKKGGDFLMFRTDLGNWDVSLAGETLAWKHQPNRTDTVSAFLLALTDINGVVIKSKANKTRPLSFRDVARFSLIGETDIISERSPVYPSGQYIKQTEDKSTFDFFVSDEDARSVIVGPDIAVRKAGWRAKVELYDQLIAELQAEASQSLEETTERLEKIDAEIEKATTVIATNSDRIQAAGRGRRESWNAIQESRARIGVIDQLLDRFDLLKQHYESDMERLSFLAEGEHFLSQLGKEAHCPLCGALLDDHDGEHTREELDAKRSIQDASRAEVQKIVVHLDDLGLTVSDLRQEKDQRQTAIVERQEQLANAEREIRDELEPKIQATKQELDELLAARRAAQLANSSRTRLDELVASRQGLGPEPKQIRDKTVLDSSVGELSGRRRFCDALQRTLEQWKFMPSGVVEFDEKMDLLVAGVPRRSHGKGIRAILQSAFTVTLMLHAKDRHPGVVVLDSPLTSFKEKDSYEANEDVQRGFFEHLATLGDRHQVIILENKDPAEDLLDRMRYEHFSGTATGTRQGFYP